MPRAPGTGILRYAPVHRHDRIRPRLLCGANKSPRLGRRRRMPVSTANFLMDILDGIVTTLSESETPVVMTSLSGNTVRAVTCAPWTGNPQYANIYTAGDAKADSELDYEMAGFAAGPHALSAEGLHWRSAKPVREDTDDRRNPRPRPHQLGG